MTLPQQLRHYLYQQDRWVHKGEILKIRWQNQQKFTYFMPDHIGRVLRAMECGKWPDGRPVPDKLRIAVRPSKKAKGNEYHVLPEHKIAQYIPISEREGDIYWKHKVNV